MGRRWLLVGTVVLAVAQCALWLFSASVMWSLRNLGFPAYQAEHNARFALALFVVAAINALAVIAFLGRRRERGWLVLAAVQLGNIPVSLWASVDRDNIGWFVLSGIPAAVTLLLIFAWRAVWPATRGRVR